MLIVEPYPRTNTSHECFVTPPSTLEKSSYTPLLSELFVICSHVPFLTCSL